MFGWCENNVRVILTPPLRDAESSTSGMAYQFQELPKQTPSTGRKNSPQYADAARLAKQHPGRTLHVETDVPRSLYMSIRGYISDPFVTDEGRIQVNMRNSKVHEDGVRRGDLFFTWIPNAKEEN